MTGLVMLPGGARGLTVAALGTRVTMVFAPSVSDDVAAAAEHAWADAVVPTDGTAATTGPIVSVAAAPVDSTLSELSMRVTLAALDHVRGTSLLFHACGLALPDGRVVALVGPSGRGKTTAARRMGAVFGYVSDESVAVRDDGTVLAYRKPLSVIENGMPVKRQVAPSQAGLRPLPAAPLRLAALALLDRVAPDAGVGGTASIDEVPLSDAVVALVPQMSYLTSMHLPLQALAHAIDRVGGVARVTYAEAENLAEAITFLGERSPVTPSWRACIGTADTVPPGLIGRANVTDAIELDDGTVIALSSDTVRVLDGIAPALWRATATPRTMGQLVDAVVAAHGSPEGADPADLVGRAVDELVAAEVLRAP